MRETRDLAAAVPGPAELEPRLAASPLRTVLVAADHVLFGQAVAFSLGSAGLRAEMCLLTSPDDVVERVRALAPEVLLLILDADADPRGAGRMIRRVREFGPRVVLATTGRTGHGDAECLEAGASDVLDASCGLERLAEAVGTSSAAEHLEKLTHRERAILAALMDGRGAEDIASREFVSVATVRSQIRSILRKLGVNSQLAAVAHARRAGWEWMPEVTVQLGGRIHQSWG